MYGMDAVREHLDTTDSQRNLEEFATEQLER
jgi:hypothetical protein